MNKNITVEKITVNIGLDEEIRLLFSSDNHICLADSRDNDRKIALSDARSYRSFGLSPEQLCKLFVQTIDYAENNNLLYLSTGDIADFVSYSCLDFAKKQLSRVDSIFAVGNHEFSKYVGEAKENAAYKADSLDLVQSFFHNDLNFDSRIVKGVNFVTLDNVYYNITSHQLERLKAEVAKGYPIILAFHTPIYTPELYDFTVNQLHSSCCYCIACPDELMKSYSADRYEQQKADAPTLDFIDYCSKQPLIKAVFAGHLHEFFMTTLHWANDVPQIIANGGYRGAAYDVTIK